MEDLQFGLFPLDKSVGTHFKIQGLDQACFLYVKDNLNATAYRDTFVMNGDCEAGPLFQHQCLTS